KLKGLIVVKSINTLLDAPLIIQEVKHVEQAGSNLNILPGESFNLLIDSHIEVAAPRLTRGAQLYETPAVLFQRFIAFNPVVVFVPVVICQYHILFAGRHIDQIIVKAAVAVSITGINPSER